MGSRLPAGLQEAKHTSHKVPKRSDDRADGDSDAACPSRHPSPARNVEPEVVSDKSFHSDYHSNCHSDYFSLVHSHHANISVPLCASLASLPVMFIFGLMPYL